MTLSLQMLTLPPAENVNMAANGSKVLTGKELEDGMFDFLLYEADEEFTAVGEAIDRSSNNSTGIFTFRNIEMHEGEYYYVVMEDRSESLENVTYDESIYGVKISAHDDKKRKPFC